MSSTSDADILLVDPNQTGKAAAIDTALAALDSMMGDTYAVTPSSPGFGSPFTIPYSAGDEPVGIKTAIRFILMTVNGALGADWTAYFPAGKKKLFLLQNATTGGHNAIAMVKGQTGVTVPPGSTFLCYLNGTDVVQMPIAAPPGSQPWDVANFIDGRPTAGLVLMRTIFARTVTFPAQFANNQLKAGTAPSANAVLNVNKNGSLVGTATISTGSSVGVWGTSSPSPVVFNAGDVLTFVAPNPADSALADFDWVFSGTR